MSNELPLQANRKPLTIPLFILGKQRSGTTWLANQLCEHSMIAGVKHERHKGVHESAYFSHVDGRYGNLRRKPNYIEFVEAMAVSDTMRILEIDKAFLYSLWPTTYEQVFQTVMDRHAGRLGARYWLDKTPEHTLIAHKLSNLYPDARFVATIRNVHDVVNSTITRYQITKRNKIPRVIKVVLSWLRYKKAIEQFAKHSDKILVISYEELKEAPERTYRKICNFLALEFESAMLQQHYIPNTTFLGGRDRSATLSSNDHQFIDVLVALEGVIPKALLDILSGDFRYVFKKRNLPSWFFSMYKPVPKNQHQDD